MQELFRKYLENQCSPEEVKELLACFKVPENENILRGLIIESLESFDADDDFSHSTPALNETFIAIKKELDADKVQVVPIFRRTWFRIAAAAVFVVGSFALFNFINKSNRKADIARTNISTQPLEPGNRAILVLADGSNIDVETAANGFVSQQGNSKIVKSANGHVVYRLLKEKPTEVLFNSIITPRGGQYQVTLSDGTNVWLNSESSLRFPSTFVGNERKVVLSGEAYFEVAKNSAMPFKVDITGKGEVEVLGTHFNVNAYSDEAIMNTTLLEGRVKVVALTTRDSLIISPGEQAHLDKNNQIRIRRNADIPQAIAWKNGVFNFNNADLGTVMRQLSRWYDVDIIYEGTAPQRQFNGEIQRDLKLSQVLLLLEKNNVFCKLEGNTLIVRH